MGERIFLIASNTALIDQLTEILAGAGLSIAGTANDADQARSSLQYIDTDMILLVTPMGRESGDRLAKDLYYIKPYCGMIIATAAEKFPLFEKRLDDALAFLIAKPINKAALLQAIQHLQKSLAILTASRQKYLQLEKKLDDLPGHQPGQKYPDQQLAHDRAAGPQLYPKAVHGYALIASRGR